VSAIGMCHCSQCREVSGVRIERHIFVGSKAPWDEIGGDGEQFDERPPE